MRSSKPTNKAQSEAPSVDDIVEFLCGAKPLQGRWFNEKYEGIPPYWWRNHLRIAVKQQEAKINRLIDDARTEWLDEQILHLLNDIYPEDVFTPPTKEDFDRVNEFDANLHTRLHCDGIRHGLHVLRREARGLSARDDLPELSNNLSKERLE